MSISTAVTRTALTIAGALVVLGASAGHAAAQDATSRSRHLEFRIPSGAFFATGDQRQQLKNAQTTAAQLSWLVGPRLALTGTFAWARSRDVASNHAPRLDVFTSDVGIESRSREWRTGRRSSVSLFGGLGAGARTYNYRKLEVDATNNLAGYVAAGGEVGMGRVGVRLEARNYVTGFKPLVGSGESDTRNDVVIMGALRFNRDRGTSSRR